ncbi:hypothetical protein KIL84_005192 [Mauremys mutica]|uniref:Uncharacterized protein n=1 Tax=Mauremys mutica TaxID=74926 RepID=A0A9D3XKH1_9SAUR|nr:hypothetical protein KIL84_005192 [Mauremys mutica]
MTTQLFLGCWRISLDSPVPESVDRGVPRTSNNGADLRQLYVCLSFQDTTLICRGELQRAAHSVEPLSLLIWLILCSFLGPGKIGWAAGFATNTDFSLHKSLCISEGSWWNSGRLFSPEGESCRLEALTSTAGPLASPTQAPSYPPLGIRAEPPPRSLVQRLPDK